MAISFGKKRPICLFALLFLFLVAATAWMGYKKILTEVAAVKSEVAARKEFIPPLFGSRHVALRKRFILDQISQADQGVVLVIGDSIVEGMNLSSVAGVPVINAGMGGGGVLDAKELIAEVKSGAPISGVIIAIGVNDTVLGDVSPTYLAHWESAMRGTISKAKNLVGSKLAVSTIIPVEKGKPLGDQYFDPTKIQEINRLIRKVCAETRTTLIDQEPSFSELAVSGVEYTTDGVHLNAAGYRLLKSNLHKAVRW